VKGRNTWLVYLVGSITGAIVLVVAYIAYLILSTPQQTPIILTPQAASNGITAIEPPLPMSDFTLTDQFGEPIQLSDLAGKPTLLTFGFTHCPDICPITLGEMRNIHELLGAEAEKLNFVFISVDGERDTPDMLRDYFELLQVDNFLVGMTGTPEAVRELGTEYGVEFFYSETDENGNYDVSHTAGMFLLDANQNWIRRYTYGTLAQVIAADIEPLLN
jgi:protein SCO1/2